MRRIIATLLALVSATAGLTIAAASTAEADVISVRLVNAIKRLPVATETRTGYERSKFRLWVDADGDCQDTRDEVLAAESFVRVKGCDIQRGKWRSYYDGAVTTQSTGFDIDHLVPLAEAWDSGAKRWTADTRERYANDLGDRRTLVAVTASSNRSKGDRDPAEWMPTLDQCKYVRQWVAVKIRWRLTVNGAEKRALASTASRCSNDVLTVKRASTVTSTSTTSSAPTTAPGGGTTASRNDPRFSYCYQAIAAGYGPYLRSRDPEYSWYTDSDGDGRVCE